MTRPRGEPSAPVLAHDGYQTCTMCITCVRARVRLTTCFERRGRRLLYTPYVLGKSTSTLYAHRDLSYTNAIAFS